MPSNHTCACVFVCVCLHVCFCGLVFAHIGCICEFWHSVSTYGSVCVYSCCFACMCTLHFHIHECTEHAWFQFIWPSPFCPWIPHRVLPPPVVSVLMAPPCPGKNNERFSKDVLCAIDTWLMKVACQRGDCMWLWGQNTPHVFHISLRIPWIELLCGVRRLMEQPHRPCESHALLNLVNIKLLSFTSLTFWPQIMVQGNNPNRVQFTWKSFLPVFSCTYHAASLIEPLTQKDELSAGLAQLKQMFWGSGLIHLSWRRIKYLVCAKCVGTSPQTQTLLKHSLEWYLQTLVMVACMSCSLSWQIKENQVLCMHAMPRNFCSLRQTQTLTRVVFADTCDGDVYVLLLVVVDKPKSSAWYACNAWEPFQFETNSSTHLHSSWYPLEWYLQTLIMVMSMYCSL